MVKKILFVLCVFLITCPAISSVCDGYKKNPEVYIEKAEWTVNIHRTDKDMGSKAGYVNIQPFNSFVPKIGYTFNGEYYCVFLDSVQSTIGFRDFDVFIDKKFEVDSCEYNAVLDHEYHHINDSVDALDNVFPKIKEVLQEVANSVEPVYVKDPEKVPEVFDKITKEMMNNKKLMDLVDDFKKQQERDASVLDDGPDENLKKCMEEKIKAGIDKVEEAFKKYFKDKN